MIAEARLAGTNASLGRRAVGQSPPVEPSSSSSASSDGSPHSPPAHQPLPPQSEVVPAIQPTLEHRPSTPLKAPPNPSHITPFVGKSTGEYNTFQNQLQAHFNYHQEYFENDDQKVVLTVTFLDTNTLNQWAEFTASWTKKCMWQEF